MSDQILTNKFRHLGRSTLFVSRESPRLPRPLHPARSSLKQSRILSVAETAEGPRVTFSYRDRKHGDCARTMTLQADEFIRRFLLHVLPNGFMRIRHFGFMANYQRAASLDLCRQLLDMAPIVRST